MTPALTMKTTASESPGSGIASGLIRRIHDRALAGVAPLASGRLVEIVHGEAAYHAPFGPYTSECQVVSHDAVGVNHGPVDVVLCANVLQHAAHPQVALRQARDLLGPGGLAIYTAPFLTHVSGAPRDFFRYSPYGLRHLFEQAGFEIEEIRPLSGFLVSVTALFTHYLERFHAGLLGALGIIPLIQRCTEFVIASLARYDRSDRWTCMYLVIARVPDDARP